MRLSHGKIEQKFPICGEFNERPPRRAIQKRIKFLFRDFLNAFAYASETALTDDLSHDVDMAFDALIQIRCYASKLNVLSWNNQTLFRLQRCRLLHDARLNIQ